MIKITAQSKLEKQISYTVVRAGKKALDAEVMKAVKFQTPG